MVVEIPILPEVRTFSLELTSNRLAGPVVPIPTLLLKLLTTSLLVPTVSPPAKVLVLAGKPMNTKAMVEKMLADGLWKTGGKTPAATIYAAILREVRAKGKDARFRKTDRGLFEATAAAKQ